MNKKIEISFAILLRFIQTMEQQFYYVLMPILVLGLNSSAHKIKLTVSWYFVGLMTSIFFSGALLDRYGLKKCYWVSLVLFIVGSVICINSHDAYHMMLGRCLQGLGFGTMQVLSKKIIAHEHQPFLYNLYLIFMMIAPPIGMFLTTWILSQYTWPLCFVFFLGCACVPAVMVWPWVESPSHARKSSLLMQFKYYDAFLRDRRLIPLVLSYSLSTAMIAPYYMTVTYTSTEILHESAYVLTWIASLFTVVGGVGSMLGIISVHRAMERYIMPLGFGFILSGTLGLWVAALLWPPSFFWIVAPFALCILGTCLFYAKFCIIIVEAYAFISRSEMVAILAFSSALISVLSTYLCSFHNHTTLLDTSRLLLGMSVLSMVLYQLSMRSPNKS